MSVPIRAQIKPQIKPEAPPNDLWRIAEFGDIEELEKARARGAEVNVSNSSGVTPLMVAAYHGRLQMVRALIGHGAHLNAVDSDGFTAVMLADHSGHEDIVRTLVGCGAKGIPTAPAPDISRSAQDETFDALSDPDVAPTSRNPELRTLHEPPEIWDLVHETRTEFNPRSAFVTHLTSVNPIVLAAIALIIGGGAVFWFMKPSSRSGSDPAAPSVRAENSNTKTASSSQVTVPNRTVSPPNQPTTNTPSTDIAGSTVKPGIVPNKIASPTNQPTANALASAGIAGSRVEPNITVAAPAALSAKRVVARPPRQNPKSSGTTGSVTVAGTDNKDKAQNSMTLSPKSDNEKRPDPTAKKESAKAPTPQLIAPAKSSPSPKAKVIQWP